MPGFFTIGVTIACYIAYRNVAESSEPLTSLTSIAVMVVPAVFTNHVDTGSRAHCLLGQHLRSRSMSSVATWLYYDKLVLHMCLASVGGAPVVEARVASTLPYVYPTIHERDRRTDTGRQHRPRLRIASRGKNDKIKT